MIVAQPSGYYGVVFAWLIFKFTKH